MMQMSTSTARALRYAARLIDRAQKGKDLGDTIGVGQVYDGDHAGKARVELHLFSLHGADVSERAAAVRAEIGGIFGENDAHGTPFDAMYQRMERPEEDFLVAVTVLRSAVDTLSVSVDESNATKPVGRRKAKAVAE